MKSINIVLLSFLLNLMFSCQSKEKKSVLIQPYGDFPIELANEVKKSIEDSYEFDVSIANSIELPATTFVNVKSPRYRADSLIRIQKRKKPDSVDFILGLTVKDISTTKKGKDGKTLEPASRYEDWGVFGLGYRPGESAIVSTFRLTPSNQTLMRERLLKVCNHELGHNLGLPHCAVDENCVMRDAVERIVTVDEASVLLCNACKKRVDEF